tara:strand:- start:95 stop:277 length:183 start_codon:yes stop_codon:yes gene_type:complete
MNIGVNMKKTTVTCPDCGGDGYFEFPDPYEVQGEVIEEFDSEECKKCNGTGVITKESECS